MHRIEKEDIARIIETLDVGQILGKTFLITGSTGALARYCVMTLMELGKRNPAMPCKVIALCRNLEKARRIWREYLGDPDFFLLEGRVEDKIEYTEAIDYILHAACISTTQYFYSNPVEIASANVIGTYNLLKFAKEKRVKGFLFFSSGAVYGGATKDDVSYIGLEPLDYKNCYNMSKRMGENLCADFAQEYGVPAKVVRIAYTFGPHIDLNDGHLYSDFVKAILRRENLVIKGDGQNDIGMVYITDAVTAFFKVLFLGKVSTPYIMRNADERMTIEELAQELTQKVFLGRELQYECKSKSTEKKPRLAVKRPILLEELGWKIQIKMSDGFERIVRYFEEGENNEVSVFE